MRWKVWSKLLFAFLLVVIAICGWTVKARAQVVQPQQQTQPQYRPGPLGVFEWPSTPWHAPVRISARTNDCTQLVATTSDDRDRCPQPPTGDEPSLKFNPFILATVIGGCLLVGGAGSVVSTIHKLRASSAKQKQGDK